MPSIPVVDFRDWLSDDDSVRAAYVRTLGEALEEYGFVAVSHSATDPALIDRCYQAAEAAFALPEATKRAYETPDNGRQRGYTSFGVEHAKDQALPDLKEFWHVGRELPAGHPLASSGEIPPNLYPAEQPTFEPCFSALFAAQDHLVHELLRAVGAWLELPEGFFDGAIRDGNSVLRVIHYPPLGPSAPEGAVRAAAHEDINLMTILPISREPGLELLTRGGEWISVNPPPGVMVIDTGDMMKLLTGGRLPATTHRVVNPPGASAHRARYSLPFFCHPHPDFLLKPLWGEGRAITARDFLKERLVEIGVA